MREKARMAKARLPQMPPKKSKRSYLEERLALYIQREGLPAPRREYRFAPPRLWRFDFAWPERGQLALEVEGGIFVGGGHSRGIDFTDDCEKYNIAALLGWRVYRFTVKQFESGWVYEFVKAILAESDADVRALLAHTVGTTTVQPDLGLPSPERTSRV